MQPSDWLKINFTWLISSSRNVYDFTDISDNVASFSRDGREYRRPCGWKRFALKVLNEYESNMWLGRSNAPRKVACFLPWNRTPYPQVHCR